MVISALRQLFLLSFITLAAIQAQAQSSYNLTAGWNLLGYSDLVAGTLPVSPIFGDSTKIRTVWKWNQATSKWAFFTPSMDNATLSSYASSKGYEVLANIEPGEGFWVNAVFAGNVPGPLKSFDQYQNYLSAGWSLRGTASNTPQNMMGNLQYDLNLKDLTVTSMWSWNSSVSKWKFYAPALEAQGGTVLGDYIASKGYLAFDALADTDGFWMNLNNLTPVPLTVTGLSTNTGPATTVVTISGTGFSGNPANNVVTFNGTLAAVKSATHTSITVAVPSGATSGTVAVMANGDITSAGEFSVTGDYLVLNGLSWMPNNLGIGAFYATSGGNYFTWTEAYNYCAASTYQGKTGWRLPTKSELLNLYFAGVAGGQSWLDGWGWADGKGWALDNTWSSTPSAVGMHFVVPLYQWQLNLTDAHVASDTDPGNVTCVRPAPISLAPTIVQMTPNFGAQGTNITITGTNFGTDVSRVRVSFNGILTSVDTLTPTKLTVTVPHHATTGTVSVILNGAAVYTGNFSVIGSSYYVQGGLAWMPSDLELGGQGSSNSFQKNDFTWAEAQKLCANTTYLGQSDWRLPSTNELLGLANGGLQALNTLWSSSPFSDGGLNSVILADGSSGSEYLYATRNVSCVRPAGGTTMPQPPTVNNITPTSAFPGTTVTLTGSNFSTVPAENTVLFGGAPFESVPVPAQTATPTALTVVLPRFYSSALVHVTTAGGTSSIVTSSTLVTVDVRPSAIHVKGLTFMSNYIGIGHGSNWPSKDKFSWNEANAFCASILPKGFRLPTSTELDDLFASGLISDKNWIPNISGYWISDPLNALGYHYIYYPGGNFVSNTGYSSDLSGNPLTCVYPGGVYF
jgi:hypothetical protein